MKRNEVGGGAGIRRHSACCCCLGGCGVYFVGFQSVVGKLAVLVFPIKFMF